MTFLGPESLVLSDQRSQDKSFRPSDPWPSKMFYFSDELLKAQTELRAYKDLQRQKDESLRSALNQYFH